MSDVRPEDLISREAAIRQSGVHRNTFDRWAKRVGLERYRKLGDNRIFYLRADLDAKFEPITKVPS